MRNGENWLLMEVTVYVGFDLLRLEPVRLGLVWRSTDIMDRHGFSSPGPETAPKRKNGGVSNRGKSEIRTAWGILGM